MCGTLVPTQTWPRHLLIPRPRLQWQFSPSDIHVFLLSVWWCLQVLARRLLKHGSWPHSVFQNEVSVRSPCISPVPQESTGAPREGALTRWCLLLPSSWQCPMPSYTLLHQPELCLSLLTTFWGMQGCTNTLTETQSSFFPYTTDQCMGKSA